LVKDAYPSLARLASEKHFWAVRNLVRRGVVKAKELALMHEGKTALEWVKEHGEGDVAKELVYSFPVSSIIGFGPLNGSAISATHGDLTQKRMSVIVS
jgi:hypothetical protein